MEVKRFAADTGVKHTVISWLHTSDKRFLTRQNTNVGVTVGRINKCQWWLRGGLMCTIWYSCDMCTSKSE